MAHRQPVVTFINKGLNAALNSSAERQQEYIRRPLVFDANAMLRLLNLGESPNPRSFKAHSPLSTGLSTNFPVSSKQRTQVPKPQAPPLQTRSDEYPSSLNSLCCSCVSFPPNYRTMAVQSKQSFFCALTGAHLAPPLGSDKTDPVFCPTPPRSKKTDPWHF